MAVRRLAVTALVALLPAMTAGCVNLDKPALPQLAMQAASGWPAADSKGVTSQRAAIAAASGPRESSPSISTKLMRALPRRDTPREKRDGPARDDPTSLSYKPPYLGADLYIAAARLAEKNGNVDEALQQYGKALEKDARNRRALIGMGRLQHRMGRMREAVETYRRALSVHRDDPVILNDLGLCHARGGQLDQAIGVLGQAVNAAPEREMYRNNLAASLVEAGRPDEALTQLSAIHGPAIANYNVGYLMNKSERKQQAASYLTRALRIDPSLQSARNMLQELAPQLSTLPAERRRVETTRAASRTDAPSRPPRRSNRYWVDPAKPGEFGSSLSSPENSGRPGGTRPVADPAPPPPHLRRNTPSFGPFGYRPARASAVALAAYEQSEDVPAGGAPESLAALAPAEPELLPLRMPTPDATDGWFVPPLP